MDNKNIIAGGRERAEVEPFDASPFEKAPDPNVTESVEQPQEGGMLSRVDLSMPPGASLGEISLAAQPKPEVNVKMNLRGEPTKDTIAAIDALEKHCDDPAMVQDEYRKMRKEWLGMNGMLIGKDK